MHMFACILKIMQSFQNVFNQFFNCSTKSLCYSGFFFTKFLEDLVGPTLRQAEFFVLSFEFFSYSEFFWAEDTK